MHRILTFVTRLTSCCLRSLHHRFVAWTKPDTTSLLLGTLTDLARSKSKLMAENALLRQQLIILRRQVKRPACTKTDRMLLVLLARAVQAWGKGQSTVGGGTYSWRIAQAGHSRRQTHCSEVHEAYSYTKTARTELGHLPAKPCQRHVGL